MFSTIKRLPKNCSGYTLVDALLQLMVLLLFSQLFTLFYPWYEESYRTFHQRQEIEWELFTYDFQSYLLDIKTIGIGSNANLYLGKNNRSIAINRSSAVVRMQKEGQGNEPMLMNVYEIQFFIDANRTTLTTKILFTNGLRKEKDFAITYVKE